MGKFAPSLRVSKQMHPGVVGLQASTLSREENHGLPRPGSRHRARPLRGGKKGTVPKEPEKSVQSCCIPGSRCYTSK